MMEPNWILDFVSPASLAIALVTFLVAVIFQQLKSNSGIPPGPTGLPFVGYLPFIPQKEPHLHLAALQKRYGDIFSFTCTGRLFIHLGTVKAVREAHMGKSDCFAKRNDDFNLMKDLFEGGVAFLNSEAWKVNRKFFQVAMKERGLVSLQASLSGTSLYDSIESTVASLRNLQGQPVNIIESLTNKCNTTLRNTLFGEGDISEDLVREINEYFAAMMSCLTGTNFLPSGFIAKYLLLPWKAEYRDSKAFLKKAEHRLYKLIDEHKSSFDEENIRNIIDEYIKERNLRRSKGDPTAQYFTDEALMSTLIQIIGDGSLSVSMFIALVLKAAVDHPEEQDKIHKELVEVVGQDRNPTIEDKSKLTYTNAFVLEALRTSADFFPFFPSLECTKETTLRGYRIPKGSITVTNFYTAHRDPETYNEPEKFDPTRFLVKEGKQRADLPITFGVGKRACIGEAFTMMQVLLFVTTIIKNFHIRPEDGKISNSEILVTGKFPVILQLRNQK